MSTKLVFTAPSVPVCEEVVDLLRSLGITDDSIGVIASDQLLLPTLPDADFLESDVVPSVKRGAAVGAVTGVVAGLGMTIAAPGIVIGGAGLALAALGGASVSALSSGLRGASAPNTHIQEYEEALEKGELLLIVDVADEEESSVRETLLQRFPSLTIEGEIPGSAAM